MSTRRVADNNSGKELAAEFVLPPGSGDQRIFEATTAATLVLSAAGLIESANPAACRLTGFSNQELVGKPFSMGESDYAPQSDLAAWRSVAPGEQWRGERICRTKSGSSYFCETVVTAVRGADGGVARFLVVMRDVTEIKRIEAMLIEERALLAERIAERTAELSAANLKLAHVADLLQAIVDTAGQIVVATDAEGVIWVFNPAAERLLGYRADDVIGKACPIVVAASGVLPVVRISTELDQARLSGIENAVQLGSMTEWLMERRDGLRFPAILSLKMLYSPDGEPSGYVGVATDISAIVQEEENLRRSEETLRVANAELARTLQMRDDFLASMSHELRTPLAAILSLSEGLNDEVAGPLNGRQRKYVSTISESGQHLLALVNDVLDLSKIEAGRLQLDQTPLDVDLICHVSMRMVKEQAQRKGLIGSLRIESGFTTLVADERRLKQILVNLLSNAVKFTPEGGSYGIDVRADHLAQQISFCVWDTGIGIDPSFLPYLFQPFVQVDTRLARQQGGTGLGLALVRRMAELHGGWVEVKSTPGKGTRFVVTLPWRQEEFSEEPGPGFAAPSGLLLPQSSSVTQSVSSGVLAHSTILLVEDHESTAIALHDYLASRGCTVLKARSGADALQIALAVRPDLILMDIQMPDMDGIETTRRLRTYPHMQSVVVIALTALASQGNRERCLAVGMADFLTKPVEFRKLAQVIEQHLANSRPLP